MGEFEDSSTLALGGMLVGICSVCEIQQTNGLVMGSAYCLPVALCDHGAGSYPFAQPGRLFVVIRVVEGRF